MEKPINYRIDRKMKTVFVKFTGETSIEDLIEQEKMIIKDNDFEIGFNNYVDFSEATPSHTVNFDKVKMSKDMVSLKVVKLRFWQDMLTVIHPENKKTGKLYKKTITASPFLAKRALKMGYFFCSCFFCCFFPAVAMEPSGVLE